MFPSDLEQALCQSGIVAVVVIDRVCDALPLAHALLAGGVRMMELTLRTPSALEALGVICQEVPDMIAGAGTVLTPEQAQEVVVVGAAFGVSPGLNPAVLEAARRLGLPFAPGVMTPSDIEAAIAHGCRTLKFFPAEAAGGVRLLRAIAAPYAHLGIRFIPLGGLDEGNFSHYLREGNVAAVGGSWIAPRELIAAGAWGEITARARAALGLVEQIRKL